MAKMSLTFAMVAIASAFGVMRMSCDPQHDERVVPLVKPPSSARALPAGPIRADGFIDVGTRKLRLIGIRPRPLAETKEPHAADLVRAIVSASGTAMRVQVSRDGSSAIVYYRQPVEFDAPVQASGLFLLYPNTAWVTLNELLIDLGLAFYDPADPELPAALAVRLKYTQLAYARAVYRGYPLIYRENLAKQPSLLFEDYVWWFRPRIAKGDLNAKGSQSWLAIFDPRAAAATRASTQPRQPPKRKDGNSNGKG